MYFVLISILIGVAAYLYHWFVRTHPIPALTNQPAHTVNFEAVVPTIMEEEITLELPDDFAKEWEQHKPVLIEEADTVLLLEAEKLVSEVETIVASKVDVYEKLQQVIPGFALLHKTDYYDPINTFIAMAVKSETGIELSEKELAGLWD